MHDFNIQLYISGLLTDSTDLFFECPKFKSLAMIGNSWPASGLLYVKAFNHVLHYLTGVTVNYNVVRAGWVHIHACYKQSTNSIPSFLFTIFPFTCFFLFCNSNVSMDHCFCKLQGAKYVSTSLFRFMQYTVLYTGLWQNLYLSEPTQRSCLHESRQNLAQIHLLLTRDPRNSASFLKANSTAFCNRIWTVPHNWVNLHR